MNIKIEDVVSFGEVLRALFKANYGNVIAIDADFTDPWLVNTFDVQKQDVNDMVTTPGLKKLNKGETAKRDTLLDSMLLVNANLDYAIGKCITGGSIGDSKSSFGIGALNKAIRDRNIGLYHTSYEVTLARINEGGNAAALNAKGFTTVMQDNFSKIHDAVWKANTYKINLSQNINTLSGDDKIIVDTFMTTCMLLIGGIKAAAKSTGDKVLAKKATFNGIKKMVEPTLAKKARNLKIKEFGSRVVATKVASKHKLQFTLMTKGVVVTVCRQDLKTGVCTVGTPLVFGTMLEVVVGDLLGTGDYVVITNGSGKKIVVKFLKIVVA